MTTAQVPVLITHKMRQDLEAAGYSSADIDAMTPAQAWEVMGGMPSPAASMLDAALEYQRMGLAVIPLQERDKRPAVPAWKEYQDRPASEQEIRAWWGKTPAANMGIVCGPVSGIVVLDIDNPQLAQAELDAHAPLPVTPTVKTAKGRHYYFAHPGGEIRPRKLTAPDGTPWGDLKANGGYVVAPPSVHPAGDVYAWEVPLGEGLASLPAWLYERPAELAPAIAPAPYTPPDGGNGHGDPYAAAALRNEIDAVRSAPVGTRNNTFNKACFALGEFIGAGRLDRAQVEAELEAAGRACGLDKDTGGERGMFATMYSGLEAGVKKPRLGTPPRLAAGHASSAPGTTPAGGPAELPPLSPELAQELNELNCTDSGNGEALAMLYGELLRFDHTASRWLCWDGVTRWAPDRNGEALRLAQLMARQRRVASAQEGDPDKSKALGKWAIKSENAYSLGAALDMARVTSPLAATAEQFDQDPWLLGCGNGALNLRTGDLLPGRPDLALTLSTGIAYDPGADCPRWKQFLTEVFKGDAELIAFIRRAIGYTLTGHTTEQCLFLCYGSGANGKSVFLQALRMIMGEYAHNTDFGTFLDARPQAGGAASPDLAALHGARLVTASEVKEDRRLNEARIKSLTGGDPVTARPLYGRPFTFTPTFKLWLAVNHKPVIKETGMAIWRRVRLIPFMAYFSPEIADPDLPAKLQAEAPGILAWAAAGCTGWDVSGLGLPAAVQTATAAYQAEQDTAGRFVAECCNVGDTMQAVPGELYRAYKAHCEGNGEEPLTANAFGRYIGERFDSVGKNRKKRYIGLELAKED